MQTIARTLFGEIIDYAGLFPPARLTMRDAVARFLDHRGSSDGWMLGRFVCPATRLAELAPLVTTAEGRHSPVRLAVLGTGGDDPPTLAATLERDLEAIASFVSEFGAEAPIEVFELKLPTKADPAETVDFVCDQLARPGRRSPHLFFEAPLLGDWRPAVELAARAVAVAGHEADRHRDCGLKIRCGGLEAMSVPSVEAVAGAVIAARNAEVQLKATQGLHHPFRHDDASLRTTVHGFVNLIAAAVLAKAHVLDAATVEAIVAEQDPQVFAVTGSALRWRDLEADIQAIVEGRQHAVAGFGSCSFSEPRADLADLGWI